MIEMLMVLTIFSIMILTTQVAPLKTLSNSYQLKVFKDQLKTHIYLAQEHSILYQDPYYVKFIPGTTIYFIQGQSGQIVDQIECPQGWSIINYTTFTYLPSGRTDHFRTVYFRNIDGQEIALAFQLGSGQFVFKS